jgi:hypothetical protein
MEIRNIKARLYQQDTWIENRYPHWTIFIFDQTIWMSTIIPDGWSLASKEASSHISSSHIRWSDEVVVVYHNPSRANVKEKSPILFNTKDPHAWAIPWYSTSHTVVLKDLETSLLPEFNQSHPNYFCNATQYQCVVFQCKEQCVVPLPILHHPFHAYTKRAVPFKEAHSTLKKPNILTLKSNFIAALEITICPDMLPLKTVIALKIKIGSTIANPRNRLIKTGRLYKRMSLQCHNSLQ